MNDVLQEAVDVSIYGRHEYTYSVLGNIMKYLRVDRYQSKRGLRTNLDHPGFSHEYGLKTGNHRQGALQVGFRAIR